MNDLYMSSMQRFLTTTQNKEPDRVPLFLFLTIHGARELGLSIRQYFSKAEYVAEAQIRMQRKYRHDCLYAFYYAAIEIEAWGGGQTIFRDDGPPNSGGPFIKKPDDILSLKPPSVHKIPVLGKVLETIRILKSETGDRIPIIGVVMSPFSVPVMQMGFSAYLDLMYGQPELFEKLMQLNETFCVDWANAQLQSGVSAICYFDPVSSPSIVPVSMYKDTGFQIARRTISAIKGPTITHFASAPCYSILNLVSLTGTKVIAAGSEEDLADLKKAASNKITLMGNLNCIAMRHMTKDGIQSQIKKVICKAARGGGFILADSHGEIPWQIKEETISHIASATDQWGRYPLNWAKRDGR